MLCNNPLNHALQSVPENPLEMLTSMKITINETEWGFRQLWQFSGPLVAQIAGGETAEDLCHSWVVGSMFKFTFLQFRDEIIICMNY